MARARLAPAVAALLLAAVVAGCDDEGPTAVRDVTPPAAPQALYSVTGDGQVTLHWVPNTEPDLLHYNVWRGPAFDGPYTKLDETTSTTYVDDAASNSVTYYYAVSAVDRSGNESDLSSEAVFDTPRPEGFGLNLLNADVDPNSLSGYDFSSATRRLAADPATDVYFAGGSGLRLLVARDLETDIQDAGYHELDDLDWVPDGGWAPSGEVEAILGHSYYVWTRDNHFAKVRVTAVDNAHVVLDWAYQLDEGNPELPPGTVKPARRATMRTPPQPR